MKCEQVQDRLLTDHLDGELRAGEKTAVETHLAGCPACREFFEAVRKTVVDPFRGVPEMQPDEAVWLRIRESLEAEKESARGWFGRLADGLTPLLRVPRPIFTAAFVTALILVVVTVARWPLGTVEPAYAYLEEQMTFMTDLGAGNTELMNGDLKDYDAVMEGFGG